MTRLFGFQLTAARRRLGANSACAKLAHPFQLTAARRRLANSQKPQRITIMTFQLTAARRRLGPDNSPRCRTRLDVSTHSRPKAAGWYTPQVARAIIRFNSQPPEGGWKRGFKQSLAIASFNSQPPEGGWNVFLMLSKKQKWFQLTAARRRLVPPLKPLTGKACIALFR